MIPVEAVEAAAKAHFERDGGRWDDWTQEEKAEELDDMRAALEAAAQILLSHECEQTRLAHLDAMVNRETKQDELAAEYRRGYRDGLIDRKQVTAEPRD